MCRKIFQFYGVYIPIKYIESKHFHSCGPLPTQNLPPGSCHHTLCREKLLIPPVSIFRKSVSSKTERGGGKFDLLYQNLIRKYENDLEY